MRQLTCIAVIAGGDTALCPDLSKGRVLDRAVPGPVRVGRDARVARRKRTFRWMVREHPFDRIDLVQGRADRHGLVSSRIELLDLGAFADPLTYG